MSGRPDFSTAGSAGSGQTVAVNTRPEISDINEDQTTSVASGSSETVAVYSPVGSVYNTLSMTLQNTDTSGTSGSHSFDVRTVGRVLVAKGVSTYNTSIKWQYGHWSSADSTAQPSDVAAAKRTEESLRATENSPIEFTYNNNKDVSVSTNRVIRLTVEEVSY